MENPLVDKKKVLSSKQNETKFRWFTLSGKIRDIYWVKLASSTWTRLFLELVPRFLWASETAAWLCRFGGYPFWGWLKGKPKGTPPFSGVLNRTPLLGVAFLFFPGGSQAFRPYSR